MPRGGSCADTSLTGIAFVMHSLLLLVDSGLITGTRTCWWVTNAGSRSTGMCLTGAKLADWLFLIVIWTSERTPCSTTAMVVGHQNNGWLNKLSLSLKLWHWILGWETISHSLIIVSLGGGAVFGPFFIRNRPFNAAEYLRLLNDEVFPEIHGFLGDRRWSAATWMQV